MEVEFPFPSHVFQQSVLAQLPAFAQYVAQVDVELPLPSHVCQQAAFPQSVVVPQ